jgi:PPOX class probable F420-dependent enzyme
MIELSDNTKNLVQQVFPAIVGTKRRNGTIHLTPVWFEYDDGYFWLNSFRGSKWLENLEREGEATLALIDPKDMYRYAEIRGRLVEAVDDPQNEHIDRLSMRYRGEPYKPMMPGQRRVKIQLEPVSVRSSLDWEYRRPPAQNE